MSLIGISTAAGAQTFSTMFSRDRVQGVGFGVRAGLNVSAISGQYSSSESLDLKARAGFQVGGVADIQIFNGFYVQPGLFLTTRGARYKDSYVEDDYKEEYKESYRPLYLQVPVLASFRIDVSPSVGLQVNVGPYFAVGLGGKVKEIYTETDGGQTDTEKYDYPFFGKSSDDKDRFGAKRFDMGLSFGAGVTILSHYYIGLQYDLGLVNMVHKTEWGKDTKMHNGNFAVHVGYNF